MIIIALQPMKIPLFHSSSLTKPLGIVSSAPATISMKVTVMLIVIGALGMISKSLVKGLEDLKIGGRAETIQTIALLRSIIILRRVLKT